MYNRNSSRSTTKVLIAAGVVIAVGLVAVAATLTALAVTYTAPFSTASPASRSLAY